ncbi:MAG: hypothetical protein ACRECR_00440, partial [Thermoplasmata archaeon]
APDGPPAGQPLGPIRPLFPRVEARRPAPETSTRPVAAPMTPPAKESIPLQIRSGRVVLVEPHPSADRLYRLDVDLGEAAPRVIVAGLRPFLGPEAIRDQEVLILANLAPRTIRSVTSHGMLLAADSGGSVTLLHPFPGTTPGALIEGATVDASTISIEELERNPLVVGRVVGPGAGGRSRIDLGGRQVEAPGDWEAGRTVVVCLGSGDGALARVLAFGAGRPAGVDGTVLPGTKVR